MQWHDIVLGGGSHKSKLARIRPKSQSDKYMFQFKQIHLANQTNTFCNSNKYILKFKQMQWYDIVLGGGSHESKLARIRPKSRRPVRASVLGIAIFITNHIQDHTPTNQQPIRPIITNNICQSYLSVFRASIVKYG